jgi:hypothetical protein
MAISASSVAKRRSKVTVDAAAALIFQAYVRPWLPDALSDPAASTRTLYQILPPPPNAPSDPAASTRTLYQILPSPPERSISEEGFGIYLQDVRTRLGICCR